MKIVVKNTKQKRMKWLRILSLFMAVFLFWFIHWSFIQPALNQDGAAEFFYAMIGIFILFIAFSFYGQARPRIELENNTITIFKLFGGTQKIPLTGITSRKVAADYGSPYDKQPQKGIPSTLSLTTPNGVQYCYYRGNELLFSVSTTKFQAPEKLDEAISMRIEGKIPSAAVQAAVPEKSVKKRSVFVFALIALIGLGCYSFIGKSDPKWANPLAQTTWVAANDKSEWLFNKDGSFEWYRTAKHSKDNVFIGTYTAHIGNEAVDSFLAHYPDVPKDQKALIKKFVNQKAFRDSKILLIDGKTTSFMLNGKEKLTQPTVSLYLGTISDDQKRMNVVNIKTGTLYKFQKK